ncbi:MULTISPECIES: nucleoside/nucleotide kinase family protein [unclassified Devosia]|uniref:nucleoside/nucleotide kinase family protein n=1 Tax=unclassified Devosia TaxID=196773 RepID=UPI001AD5F078|nr:MULTISPECIES: nucleoside/nucleotide kinase family protein [unclassified Devosia]MBN9306893.1 nucleoside/nucleotide kinase family protein [Devosia sp.]
MEQEPQSLSLTPDAALALLRREAEALLAQPGRRVLGIAGGPGTGKSTMAQRLAAELGGVAAYVPMDGFHMKHAKLESLGTAADKGMPHTFEGAAFADFLMQLKAATADLAGPGYSRKIEDVVDEAFVVPATTRLLVVEGNYLLLATAPWWRVRPLLDRAIFLAVPRELVRARLMKRHAEEGLFTEARNRAHIERVDLVNYDTVMRSRPRADIAIDIVTAD